MPGFEVVEGCGKFRGRKTRDVRCLWMLWIVRGCGGEM